MKFTYCLMLPFFNSFTRAWKLSEPAGHHWHPPGPHDSRSPCPGLNAMANHGYLPRSGKNLDLPTVQAAADGAFNFSPELLATLFQPVQDFNLSTTGNFSTFNLQDLAKHDTIEFDGSLSRNDFYFGDDLHFDPAIWGFTAEKLGLYDHNDSTGIYVTIESAAEARAARVADAKRINPAFNASQGEIMGSPGTTALYLMTLWDYSVNATYKDWVRSFFEWERIPYLEGYGRRNEQSTSDTLRDFDEKILSVPV